MLPPVINALWRPWMEGRENILRRELAAIVERDTFSDLECVRCAIVSGAREQGLSLSAAEGFQSVTGKGVQGTVEGRTVAVGGAKLLGESRGLG